MRKKFLLPLALFLGLSVYGQNNSGGSATEKYLAEQKVIGNSFSAYFYPNYSKMYSLPETEFVSKIDSAKNIFDALLKKYNEQLDREFVKAQQLEIKYYFDKLLLDFPNNHDTYLQTGRQTNLSAKSSKRNY